MLVKIEEIQDKGLELHEPIASAVLVEALTDAPGFKLVKPGTLNVQFKKLSGRVLLSGDFSADLEAPCKRCATEVALKVPVEFQLRLVPEKAYRDESASPEDDGRAPNAGTFELDSADAEPFDGKTIDLDPIVREQVLLALPVSVLCRDDCKGLCATCGQDLNEKECGCERKVVDVRLAKLKDIKLN